MLETFKEISLNDTNYIFGGCQCICNRKLDEAVADLYAVGKAGSLSECSEVCLKNGWKLARCENPPKKEDKNKEL